MINLARAIELSETADCVYKLCIETLCKRATSAEHLTTFSFELLYEIFTEDASLFCLYHGAKKVKKDQKLKSRGHALKRQCHDNRWFLAAILCGEK